MWTPENNSRMMIKRSEEISVNSMTLNKFGRNSSMIKKRLKGEIMKIVTNCFFESFLIFGIDRYLIEKVCLFDEASAGVAKRNLLFLAFFGFLRVVRIEQTNRRRLNRAI
uniref:Uncharacterized protein n=1 Tax=Romanomermis culicivorax TaxID=13658 RepID=A0A915I3K6_ROMCU